MKKLFSFVFLAAVIASCGQIEGEVTELSEILPSSDRNYDAASTDGLNPDDSMAIHRQEFLAYGIFTEEVQPLNKQYLPDRFGALSSDKFILIDETDTVKYCRWVYKDSVKLLSAFYNWLDNFGEDRNSVRVGDEVNFSTEAFQIYVSDSTLIYVEGDRATSRWLAFHDSLGLGSTWKFAIEQRRAGKAKWFTYLDGEKKPLDKTP